jgi:uncharacterized MAPEG superfamily protein
VHVTVSLANLTSRPIVALLGFTAWTIVLVLGVLGARAVLVLLGRKRPNEFPGGVPHGGDAYWRLNRALANALENLAVFAAIVLSGAALGVSSARLAMLSEVVLASRVAQSLFHLASGRSLVVLCRATAYSVQVACFLWMIVETFRLATGA